MMTRRRTTLLTALLLLAVATAGAGEKSAKEPDPATIVRRAYEKARRITSAELDMRMETLTGDGKTVEGSRALEARIAFRRPELPPASEPFDLRKIPVRFRAKGTWYWSLQEKPDPVEGIEIGYDGETLRILHPGRRTLFEIEPAADHGSIWDHVESGVLPDGLARLDSVAVPLGAEPVGRGRETIDGVECHRIEVPIEIVKCVPEGVDPEALGLELSHPEPLPDSGAAGDGTVCYRFRFSVHLWIGTEDHLVRRHATPIPACGEESGLLSATTLSNIELDPNLEDGFAEVPLPKGYGRETIDSSIFSGCGIPPLAEVADSGKPAPEFELETAGGETIRSADLRGHVVVLDFWGTWCAPCVKALPHVQALHEKYGAEVRVLGISCREPADADPARVMEERGCTYPLLVDGDETAARFGVTGYPTVVVIDPRGRIVASVTGFGPAGERRIVEAIESCRDAAKGGGR